MAYDLEEQEQIDELKAWWKRHGNLVMGTAAALLLAYAGVQMWKSHQGTLNAGAAAQYEALTKLDAKDIKPMQEIAKDMMAKYPDTAYTARGVLLVAKAVYQSGDSKMAATQFEWVRAHAKESQMQTIAQLQVAALQYDQKQYDAALKTLADKHDSGFDGLFADLRGDVLVAQGKKTEAKAAYAEALTKLDAEGKYRTYTEHKLDALGS